MHIVILMDQLAPYSKDSPVGADIAALSEQFVKSGQQVNAIVPMPRGLDPSAFSLARRLTPLSCEIDGKVFKAVRYDGRTPYGVSVHMLDFGDAFGERDDNRSQAYVQAALGTIDNIAETVDWCITYEGIATGFPQAAKESNIDVLKDTQHRFILTSLEENVERSLKAVTSADQISLTMAAAHTAALGNVQPVADMIKIGAATVLSQPVSSASPSVSALKESATVALQLAADLPVDSRIPVFYINTKTVLEPEKAIREILTHEAQVVVDSDGRSIVEQVGKRYHDRLACTPTSYSIDDVMRAVDCCIAGDDERQAMLAVSLGAVPIVTRAHSGRLVDLDDQLLSGAAFVVDNNAPEELSRAAARFLAAYGNKAAFSALIARLYRYVLTWSLAAKHHLQLMGDKSIDI